MQYKYIIGVVSLPSNSGNEGLGWDPGQGSQVGRHKPWRIVFLSDHDKCGKILASGRVDMGFWKILYQLNYLNMFI